MVNSNFILINKLPTDPIEKPTDETIIFLHQGNNLYFHPNHYKDFWESPFIWKNCVWVNTNDSLLHIIQLVQQYEYVLVRDDLNNAIGYLNTSLLLSQIYDSYQYLQAYFETIITTMDASLTCIDERSNVLVWTKGAEEIFSIPQNQILGSEITDFFKPEMCAIYATLRTGESLYRHKNQSSPDVIVLTNTNPVKLNDKIIGAVSFATDITSQVRLNQELFNASSKIHHLEQEVAKLKPSMDPFQKIKGNSLALIQTKEMIQRVGSTNASVLILGESGVGKELFAKAIHDVSYTGNAPFIPINCGAITPSLFESELFGYEKGAFSGADQKGKKGKIELARGGTLFLDEIGEMPLEMQVKLLRVLQEKRYFAVGGTKEIDADFRVVAATNRNLKLLVSEGKFREDLFYRINVFTLEIPPLRERQVDIIELTHYFLYEFSIRYNRPIHGISQNMMQKLLQYEWPGNIRELRNVIERLVVMSTDGNIKEEGLPFSNSALNIRDTLIISEPMLSLEDELEKLERKIIIRTLKQENGNKQSTAKKLGLSRSTFYNRLKKLDIPST